MKSRVSVVLLIVLGSFCVYCVQNGARPSDGRRDGAAGPVAQAAAQSTSGTSSDGGPTLLFDEAVTPTPVSGTCLSREIDISGFHTVVVHRSTTDVSQLKLGEAVGFVNFITNAGSPNIQVIDPQLGRILRFLWSPSLTTGLCSTHAFTVVGYGGGVAVAPPPPTTAGSIAN